MNVVLLVIDSLRARALDPRTPDRPRTPFLDDLSHRTVCFRRAYATECWTLPSHASLFTGLLPSEHGAHFQTMAYRHPHPTVAEQLAEVGFHTELVTRCPIFDGTIPGITRGFQKLTRPLALPGAWSPAALALALTKPRLRRQIRETGFFHPDQVRNVAFVQEFARSLFPADRLVLDHALHRMADLRREGRPYFLFCNLFDVHAPYCPVDDSLLAPVRSFGDLVESLIALDALARVGRHEYLREGFRMRERGRLALLRRYHAAIERMDEKLSRFHADAAAAGLWEDTLLIVASDHGEAFGEHELYFHDASLYEENLHVPLWVQHPSQSPEIVHDVVSLRGLSGLMLAAATGRSCAGTLLDAGFRAQHPVALAEHFHYPHVPGVQARYRVNLAAAICAERKLIVRGQRAEHFALNNDPHERAAEIRPLTFEDTRDASGVLARAREHLTAFQHHFGRAA